MRALSLTPPPPAHISSSPQNWCADHAGAWSTKCTWNSTECGGCDVCATVVNDTSARCENWCSDHAKPWSTKCAWANGQCAGCDKCDLTPSPPPATPPPPSLPPPPKGLAVTTICIKELYMDYDEESMESFTGHDLFSRVYVNDALENFTNGVVTSGNNNHIAYGAPLKHKIYSKEEKEEAPDQCVNGQWYPGWDGTGFKLRVEVWDEDSGLNPHDHLFRCALCHSHSHRACLTCAQNSALDRQRPSRSAVLTRRPPARPRDSCWFSPEMWAPENGFSYQEYQCRHCHSGANYCSKDYNYAWVGITVAA